MNTAEGIRQTIAQIDGMLRECEGRPQLERFVQHLKLRRETMENMIAKIEKEENKESEEN